MSDNIAIKVEHLGKTFKLPTEKQTSIKGAVLNFYKRKKGYEIQQALNDVSFEVKEGEFFGIVGRNGSGKSTLLKLLAGIYEPTTGGVTVNGKLTPFIELGVGFNPELTGRENIFLNGALLGFSRKEMTEMYKDIVAFAEIERFMDQKLKNYSSGMQVRLAFSIAIRAKTGILVLDEVLAVGDEAFQQKCIDVFEDYKASKRTIVLVTHDMSVVRRFCTKAMLLDTGKVIALAKPSEIAREYTELNDKDIDRAMAEANTNAKPAKISLEIFNKDGKDSLHFVTDDTLTVNISWPKDTKGVKNAGIGIVKQSGEFMFGANTFSEKLELSGKNALSYSTKLSLGPGKYFLMAGLFGDSDDETIEFLDKGAQFIIRPKDQDVNQGLTRLEYKWKT